MPAQVTSMLGRLSAAIAKFTTAQRTIAIIGLAGLVLGVIAIVTVLGKPAYSPLFTGLEGGDASAIVDQLQSSGVPYELADGGATIMVPEESVYTERIKAASAGLPSSSKGGYALLDEMGVTSSEFQQSITYKRALEGELAATIEGITGVKTASVRLAIPEETVFMSEKGVPTASVFVEMRNGVTLAQSQVEAIVHLTSASIDGMAATDVAVIDAAGTVLSAVGVGMSGTADDRATDYEARVGLAVQAMLDRVAGPGNATVVVAADVNYESAERTEETFSAPIDSLALIESTTKEIRVGAGGNAAGVLGPDNIAVPAEELGDGGSTSEVTNRTNAINKVTESRTIPAGSIERQTVSVALNADVAGALDVDEIAALVSAAAGIDPNRGDEVTVKLVGFSQAGAVEAAEALAAAEAAAEGERTAEIIRTALIAFAIILSIVLGLVFFALRSRRQKREAVDMAALNEILTAPTVPMTFLSQPALRPPAASPPAEPTDVDRQRAEISALAAEDPERAAEYLRGLMDDRQPA